MAEAYKTFRDLIEEYEKEGENTTLKSLIACFVEVIDWHPDPKNPGSGHFVMGLFEQPQSPPSDEESLINQGGSIGTPGSNNWLPFVDDYRTLLTVPTFSYFLLDKGAF